MIEVTVSACLWLMMIHAKVDHQPMVVITINPSTVTSTTTCPRLRHMLQPETPRGGRGRGRDSRPGLASVAAPALRPHGEGLQLCCGSA